MGIDSSLDNPTYTLSTIPKEDILNNHKLSSFGITVNPDVTPVVHPPRRVPVALRDKLKDELDRMQDSDIIAKVDVPTPWVNSLVIVEKPGTGKLRVCLDPQDLNNAIVRPHYPMRTLEDILPKLTGAQYFTKLDARSGYWTIQLSESSSFLTTFNTPFGRYWFKRLPFGLSCSQDLFQSKMDEILEGMDGVVAIVDDILVYGSSREEHDAHLREVLAVARKRGLKLNDGKLNVGVQEVSYFGHVITLNGLKPDPNKVSAIRDMPEPKNTSELQTILGMITYLAKFAPNLAEMTNPLRKLLAKDVEFSWDYPQQQAFEKIKELLTCEPGPILSYFDLNKPLTLQVDASKFGLGAVILQENKPVAYASKSLTPAEVNYAQIEKEMFAILFGCKRFHQYVYGHRVSVETDHKPLVSIMRKPIYSAPPRLQRMLLQLSRYDLDVKHLPGKSIPLADTLSRKFVNDTFPSLSEGMEAQVHLVLSSMPVSDRKLNDIKLATESDTQFDRLKSVILSGWPATRSSCNPLILEYWNHRDEMSILDGIVFKGSKIVIPKCLRNDMLERIHTGHMGMEKCIQRAKDVLFWPKMSAEIIDMISKCTICLEHRNSNQKEPLVSHEVPLYAWQNVATDLFYLNQEHYIVVVDYYSRFFEVEKLSTLSSQSVITKLKSIFARHGIPEKIVSDNGPQYSSQEFQAFSKEWDFTHVTSSPHYAQSNGMAEKTVQTVKRMLIKCKADRRDPYLAFLEYRTTPLDIGFSPSQLLMCRNLRSILPAVKSKFKPQIPDEVKVKESIQGQKDLQKKYYDVGSRELFDLPIGSSVRVQDPNSKSWRSAVVLHKHSDRSYIVKSTNGGTYRRNRRHLIQSSEPIQPFTDVNETDNMVPKVEVPIHPPPDLTPTLPSLPKPPDIDIKSQSTASAIPYVTRSGRTIKPTTKVSM